MSACFLAGDRCIFVAVNKKNRVVSEGAFKYNRELCHLNLCPSGALAETTDIVALLGNIRHAVLYQLAENKTFP